MLSSLDSSDPFLSPSIPMIATIPPAKASAMQIATKVPPAIAPTTEHTIKTYPEILLFAPMAIAPKTIVKKEKTIPSIPNVPISVDAHIARI